MKHILPWIAAASMVSAIDVSSSSAQEEPTSQPLGHNHEGEHHRDGESPGGFHHDFSDGEHWSTVFDDPERAAWQLPQHVVDLMQVEPGMTLVDLGAGTGYFLPYLAAAAGPQGVVLALDVEASLVDFMTERVAQAGLANTTARLVPYDDPQLESESVDRILTVDTWHHIDDRIGYAGKLLAALRPGGGLYVVDFTLESEHGPPVEHRLSPEAVAGELRAAGFAVDILDTDLPEQYVVLGRRP